MHFPVSIRSDTEIDKRLNRLGFHVEDVYSAKPDYVERLGMDPDIPHTVWEYQKLGQKHIIKIIFSHAMQNGLQYIAEMLIEDEKLQREVAETLI